MQVFIMRHGDAVLDAPSDAARQLSDKGRLDSLQMAKWLAQKQIAIDKVIVSPYIRAEQTLATIRSAWQLPETEEITALLTPAGDAETFADYLCVLAENGIKSVLIVSHLPLVGYLVSALCPQEAPPMFTPSTVACIELNDSGKGQLVWMVSPSQITQ